MPKKPSKASLPNSEGYFGEFGGRFIPEVLLRAVEELKVAYASISKTPAFKRELSDYLRHYAGRPTPVTHARHLSKKLGFEIFLKREDLMHTGSHKINNALGQIILAKRMGKKRIIAETGAGQHGVATATVCALFGIPCVVYMGAKDVERQALNVYRMRLMGATVHPVTSGSQTLKDATNEAIRDWIKNVQDTHYIIGSVVGPHPYPRMVRDFQSVIGQETKRQMRGTRIDMLVACVGGGSNAIGMFYPFIKTNVKMLGVEAAGLGVHTKYHAATMTKGGVGILHGFRSYLLQDKNGQVQEAHSISAGLDYPGVGPEHAWLRKSGRAKYVFSTDEMALRGFRVLSETEGIIPALETAHALGYLVEHAKSLPKRKNLVVCLSGRGDKDVAQISKRIKL